MLTSLTQSRISYCAPQVRIFKSTCISQINRVLWFGLTILWYYHHPQELWKFGIIIEKSTNSTDNGHDTKRFAIIINRREPRLTFAVSGLSVSPDHTPYKVFAEAVDLFGSVYREAAAFSLSYQASRWRWCWKTTCDILSTMVSTIQIVYIYYIQLSALINIYMVHAHYLL